MKLQHESLSANSLEGWAAFSWVQLLANVHFGPTPGTAPDLIRNAWLTLKVLDMNISELRGQNSSILTLLSPQQGQTSPGSRPTLNRHRQAKYRQQRTSQTKWQRTAISSHAHSSNGPEVRWN